MVEEVGGLPLSWGRDRLRFQVSPAYYAQFFTHYAFKQWSKNLPIMLNIMLKLLQLCHSFLCMILMTRVA